MLDKNEQADFQDFVLNLDNLVQQDLIALFFDWYDWYNENPQEYILFRLRALRNRINICSTTGVKDSKL